MQLKTKCVYIDNMDESIEQFLARGGKIKTYRSRADEIAAKTIPQGRYCDKNAYIQKLIEIKMSSKKTHAATAPGGRIEPGEPRKSWPNQIKTRT